MCLHETLIKQKQLLVRLLSSYQALKIGSNVAGLLVGEQALYRQRWNAWRPRGVGLTYVFSEVSHHCKELCDNLEIKSLIYEFDLSEPGYRAWGGGMDAEDVVGEGCGVGRGEWTPQESTIPSLDH